MEIRPCRNTVTVQGKASHKAVSDRGEVMLLMMHHIQYIHDLGINTQDECNFILCIYFTVFDLCSSCAQ